MDEVQRKVRVTTYQRVLESEPKIDGVFPMREWSIDVHILGEHNPLLPATVFESVTYNLHETFENPVRTLNTPPFEVKEKGWGEFEVKIAFKVAHGGGGLTVPYDLHFRTTESYQDITFNFPRSNEKLMELVSQSGSIDPPKAEKRPADQGAQQSKAKKPKVTIKGSVDLEKLSQGLEQLNEQDVLSIVQMISDNKTPDIYVKNDVDAGEFHVDLYTVPNGLLKSMWDFVSKKVEIS